MLRQGCVEMREYTDKRKGLTLGEICSRANLFPELIKALESVLKDRTKETVKKARTVLDKGKEL